MDYREIKSFVAFKKIRILYIPKIPIIPVQTKMNKEMPYK